MFLLSVMSSCKSATYFCRCHRDKRSANEAGQNKPQISWVEVRRPGKLCVADTGWDLRDHHCGEEAGDTEPSEQRLVVSIGHRLLDARRGVHIGGEEGASKGDACQEHVLELKTSFVNISPSILIQINAVYHGYLLHRRQNFRRPFVCKFPKESREKQT